MMSSDDEKRLDYLLGLTTEQERERLEVELLADDDAFARLAVAEDDLIDAYVRGELVGEHRRLFEEHWLNSPRRLARVEFARGLEAAADPVPGESQAEVTAEAWGQVADPSPRPGWAERIAGWLSISPRWQPQPLVAFVVIGLVAAGCVIAWLRADNADLRSRLAVLEAARQVALAARGAEAPGGTLPVYLLKPISRSDGVQKLAVSVGESVIRLRAVVDEGRGYQSIEAILGRGRDTTVATWRLEPDAQVVVEVPVELIRPGGTGGRYHLTLRGLGEAGERPLIGYYELEIEFYGGSAEIP